MQTHSFRRLNFQNPDEVRAVAEIDVTTPAQFDPDFKCDEAIIGKLIESFMGFSLEDFFEVATDSKGTVIAFHAIKNVPYRGGSAGSVYTIWVSPDQRGKKIGSTLKKRGEEWAKSSGLDHIFTWIHADNEKSLKLNQKLGYEIVHYKLKKKI